jgi:Subtilase family
MAFGKKLSSIAKAVIASAILTWASCNKAIQQQHSQEITQNLQAQERQKEILANLQKLAVPYPEEWISLVFSDLSDAEVQFVAANNNIFPANPNQLHLTLDDSQKRTLEKNGIMVEHQYRNVYTAAIPYTEKDNIEKLIGRWTVRYSYDWYMAQCYNFNDPDFNKQYNLSTILWSEEIGIPNVPTHEIETVAHLRELRTIENDPNNPVVVYALIDWWVKKDLTDLDWVFIVTKNFFDNSNVSTPTWHGTADAQIALWKSNNNSQIVWLAKDVPWLELVVSQNWTTFSILALEKALVWLIDWAKQHPHTRIMANMSFGLWNSSSVFALVSELHNVNWWSKAFLFGANGNSGIEAIAYPANRDMVFKVGAIDGNQPDRPLAPFSNYGENMKKNWFVSDGVGVDAANASWQLQSWSGTSQAAPWVSWPAADIALLDTAITPEKFLELASESAYDLWEKGPDKKHGLGLLRQWQMYKNAPLLRIPKTIDVALNPTMKITPRYFNNTKTTNEILKINGVNVPFVTNTKWEREYNCVFTTANWAKEWINTITYEFQVDNCTYVWVKNITLMNVEWPLPITISSFDARLIKNDVEVLWTTSTEINGDRFEIERSDDGRTFKVIGTVKATWNSSTPRSYRALDQNIVQGNAGKTFLYRIESIDKDGSSETTKVDKVTIAPSTEVSLFPNPVVNNSCTITWKDIIQIVISTTSGQRVQNTIVNSQLWQHTITMPNLPAGVYNAEAYTKDGGRKVIRFVKQ